MNTATPREGGFDNYAGNYDESLAQGLAVSGESREYFARGRLAWLADLLRKRQTRVQRVLDFGCGTGAATPFLFELLRADEVRGVDVSARSLEVAQQTYGSASAQISLLSDYPAEGEFDLVFCNGVFHHIPPGERAAALDFIYRALRPGGLFALWENNPWNPGTRYVMSRCPFDHDAITLSPPAARRLVQRGGFSHLQTDFLFIFPAALRWLRPVEPRLARWPCGAQYQVLSAKPR